MTALQSFAAGFLRGLLSGGTVRPQLPSPSKRPPVKRRPDAAATPPAASRGVIDYPPLLRTAEQMEAREAALEAA